MFRRKYIILILLLISACSSNTQYGEPITQGEPTPIPTAIIPTSPVYESQLGDVIDMRSFNARIAPITSQVIQFEIGGRVVARYFGSGDEVREGDVIAELDTALLQQTLDAAQADLDIARSLLENVQSQVEFNQQRAQLRLDLANLRLDRAQTQGGESPSEGEAFEIQVRQIERDLAQIDLDEVTTVIDPQLQITVANAEAQVRIIEEELEKTLIIAPMDGILTAIQFNEGDLVEAFQVAGVVADPSVLEARDTPLSTILAGLAVGMPVQMGAFNSPGEVYPGIIFSLPAPYGTSDDEFVHIRFDNQDDANNFTLSDRVTVTAVFNERKDVVWLPRAAIRDFNGRTFVIVQDENSQLRVDVELGIEGGGRVEIVEGLEPGLTVIGQ